MRPYEEGDSVVLPSGRRAQVVRRADEDRLLCRYMNGGPGDIVEIAAHLVRRIERGIVPPPFRYRKLSP